MSYYLIAFNNLENFDANQIHNTVTHISTITDWWHYLPNIYIVASNSDSKYISNRIIQSFKGLSFLVIKLDIRDYNGVLNRDAWEWLRKKNNQTIKLKVLPRPQTNVLPPILSGYIPQQPSTSSESAMDALEKILGIKLK